MATIREIRERYAEEATLVEVWQFKDEQRRKHTDWIRFCDDISDDTVVYDYDFYDAEDYNHTIYANCGEYEDYEGDALIIWVEYNAKERKSIERIAEENNLEIITARSGDYLTGFDTWEQIQAFCNEEQFRDGEGIFAKSKATPVIFHRRDGQQFWDRTGHTAYNPFRSSDEDIIGDGSRYMVYHRSDFKDYEDFREQEITPFIDEDDEDELSENDQQIIRNANALWEGLESCDENHAVRYDGVNGYAEIIELNCIKYYDDGHCYLIGVEINFQDDEEDKENEDYSLNK